MSRKNLLFGKLLKFEVSQNENFDYLMVDHFGVFFNKKVSSLWCFIVLIS